MTERPRWTLLALAALALAACQPPPQGGETETPAEPEERLDGVTVMVAGVDSLRVTYPVLGVLRTPGTGPVSWQAGGDVDTVEVVEGDSVRSGEILGSLECEVPSLTLAQARVGLEAAVVARDRTERAHARLLSVAESGGATAEALDQAAVALAAAELDVERAGVARDLAEESVGDCYVEAPFAARVEAVFPRAGESVAPGEPLAVLLPLSGLRLEVALVPEIATELDGDARLTDGSGLNWTLFHVSGVVDPVSGGVTTLWLPDSQVEPADGRWVDGRIVLEELSGVVLPVSTLVDRMGRGVWVVGEEDSLLFRPVEVLAEEGGRALVTGVEIGDRVVVERPGRMEEGQRVRVIG